MDEMKDKYRNTLRTLRLVTLAYRQYRDHESKEANELRTACDAFLAAAREKKLVEEKSVQPPQPNGSIDAETVKLFRETAESLRAMQESQEKLQAFIDKCLKRGDQS